MLGISVIIRRRQESWGCRGRYEITEAIVVIDTNLICESPRLRSVCHVAEANPKSTVWFVSQNHTDFGGDAKVNRDAVTHPLHPDLVEDLEDRQLTDRVVYVRFFDRLVQHLAWSDDGVDDARKKAVIEGLDIGDFDRKLDVIARAIFLDPESVGLQEETTHSAKIHSFARDPSHLDFLDVAARRDAPGGWSAQFSTPAIVTVNVTELLAKGTLEATRDMQLQIAGR